MTCLSFWIALLRAVRDVGRFDVEQIHLEVSHRRRLGAAVGGAAFDEALALAFGLAPAAVAACRCSVLASDGRFFVQELRLLSSAQRAAIAELAIPGLCGECLAADCRPLHVVGLGPHSLIEPWGLPVAILGRTPSMGHDCPPIPGLLYLADYITEAAEEGLLRQVAEAGWQPSNREERMARRICHFGYPYKYPADGIDTERRLGDLPLWTEELVGAMMRDGHLPQVPDQLTVNEYLLGQGIAPHVDSVDTISDFIAVISLGSACVMAFTHCDTRRKHPVLVERRSLLVMSGAARYAYTHHIAKRKSDAVPCLGPSECWAPRHGLPCGAGPAPAVHLLPRGRRVSLTFRRIIPAMR
eukprot:EG_transcript_14239